MNTEPNLDQIEAALLEYNGPQLNHPITESVTRKDDGLVVRMMGHDIEVRPNTPRWEIWHIDGSQEMRFKPTRRYYRNEGNEAYRIARDCYEVTFHLEGVRHREKSRGAQVAA